jgi:hypothetical protein
MKIEVPRPSCLKIHEKGGSGVELLKNTRKWSPGPSRLKIHENGGSEAELLKNA